MNFFTSLPMLTASFMCPEISPSQRPISFKCEDNFIFGTCSFTPAIFHNSTVCQLNGDALDLWNVDATILN